eukprot:PLAT4437.13.p2 GENE.PLAT4437.13~~PLAT4437.13.p2  ORF type:complete len:402 (-),score=193.69 PLAT4437.13:91-1275(-)
MARPAAACLLLVLAAVASASHQSLEYDYANFCSAIGLQVNGAAERTAVSSNVDLRLLESKAGQTGTVWQRTPMMSPTMWSTSFSYVVSKEVNSGADGFAFVIQGSSPYAIGRDASGLGYDGISSGMAIEFDFHTNKPLADGASPSISVHTSNTEHALSADEGSNPVRLYNSQTQKTVSAINNPGKKTDVTVTWNGAGNNMLVVNVNNKQELAVTIPVSLQRAIGWMNDSPQWYGFTAATGGAYMQVDVSSWSFTFHGNNSHGCGPGWDAQSQGTTGIICRPSSVLDAPNCKLLDSCDTCVSSPFCCVWNTASSTCQAGVNDGKAVKGVEAEQCSSQLLAGRAGTYEGATIALGIICVVLFIALGGTCVHWFKKYETLRTKSAFLGDMGETYSKL